MALGYCMSCQNLCNIRPGPQKWGSRECAWYPTTHWRRRHKDCGGEVLNNEISYTCLDCQFPIEETDTEEYMCPGDKREIK